MAKGLRNAKALQGGGDRERRVIFRESEVRFSVCCVNIPNLTFRSLSMLTEVCLGKGRL